MSYPAYTDQIAAYARVDMDRAREDIGNLRTVESWSRHTGHTQEIVTNPLYEPTTPNGVIGRRVSVEGLDWGLFAIKYDYAGEQSEYDDHDSFYWNSVRRGWANNLTSFGVEWDPEIRF